MNRADAPKKQPIPFGVNGQRENILPTTPAGDNTASYDAGFPPVTMILKAAGGLPPKGQDMNQILYELSALLRWASSGALNSYDATFSTLISGYPKGAVLIGDDGSSIFISTSDGNLTNPNSGGAGWFNLSTGYLKSANNLSEIRAAGGGAVFAAQTNLSIERVDQDTTETRIWSADRKTYVFVQNGVWGAYSVNAPAGIVPLAITSGGTGANDAATARTNLGLGGAATLGVGTAAGTVAAGNDTRITGAAQKASNLSDLASAATARSNLGLGTAATETVGTGVNQLPSMASFTSGSGWIRFPDGTLIQRGTSISGPIGYPTGVYFPVAFVGADFKVTTSYDSAKSATTDCPSFATSPIGTGGFYLMSSRVGASTGAGANWIAIGK